MREYAPGWPRPELQCWAWDLRNRVLMAINIVPRTGAPPCGIEGAVLAELILYVMLPNQRARFAWSSAATLAL